MRREAQGGPAVVHVVLSLDIGGAEVLVARMARSLSARGFRPQVVCLDADGALARGVREAGVPVTCVGRRPGVIDVACAIRLRRLLAALRPALVHTHEFEACFYGSLAARFAGRIPVIHTQHGLPVPFGWKQRSKVIAVRGAIRAFVGVSEEVTALGVRSGWFAPDRSMTIANGIDVEAFRPDDARGRRMRRELGIPEGDPVVISVARLAAVKDQLTLVRGFAASAAAQHGHLLIVGDGPERPGIEAEIAGAGLEGRVRLLGARSDVRDLLTAADVFALTSRSEGISVSLLEGMASGLVPVVTAVGGNTELVRADGPAPNGLLIPPGSPDRLADALGRLAGDAGLRARLAAAARATVRERFSDQAMMARYVSVYDSALSQGARRGR
jgi:glycosyltransferase involved in cell wall biosynthesis